jgi:N,N'-diacetyllegionaminate synthase
MKIGHVDTDKEILVIAEIGNNHEGSYALAEELVGRAAEAGAQAVKFQTFKTEYFVSRNDRDRFDRLKSFELSQGDFEKLHALASDLGMLFISTPLDLESAEFLNTIVSAYKIASGDNTFYPLIREVAKTGKPIIMSGGLADICELKKSRSLILGTWNAKKILQSLAILHCVCAYPVPPEQANLGAIRHLHQELQCTVGYSDHTIGIDAAVLSVALGARIIEKHFTIDKNYSDFRDHSLSADPAELKILVEKINEVSLMMGPGEKIIQNSERDIQTAVRRSIAARRNLSEGTIVKQEDIMWIRPGDGLPPGSEHRVIGGRLSRPLSMGDQILPDYLVRPMKWVTTCAESQDISAGKVSLRGRSSRPW